MVSASQIRNELAFYIAGVISLDNFEDWFAMQSWNVEHEGSKAAEDLTYEIEACLTEYMSRFISEKQLRKQLQQLIYAETKTAEISVGQGYLPQPQFTVTAYAPTIFQGLPAQP
jgi:hypothetical protein